MADRTGRAEDATIRTTVLRRDRRTNKPQTRVPAPRPPVLAPRPQRQQTSLPSCFASLRRLPVGCARILLDSSRRQSPFRKAPSESFARARSDSSARARSDSFAGLAASRFCQAKSKLFRRSTAGGGRSQSRRAPRSALSSCLGLSSAPGPELKESVQVRREFDALPRPFPNLRRLWPARGSRAPRRKARATATVGQR
jgi:hypothetical protein